MAPIDEITTRLTARLQAMLRLHFDPNDGAPYWIEVARRMGLDPVREITGIDDLQRFGLMTAGALQGRPLAEFIPRSVIHSGQKLTIVQTGGTLGSPVWTAYTREDYAAAFVTPFVEAATHVGFPGGGVWLYVGPSGPHVIGRAARSIAQAVGAADPFTVDFDPRWARKLPPGSFAAQRYLQHVIDQALAVIETQPVTHLFSMPPVLTALGSRLSTLQRERIRGVHYGGMAITADELTRLQTLVFPNAVHLSGYGNTLFGCCLELDTSAGRALRYFPHGDRLIFGVAVDGGASGDGVDCRPGARGRCVFTRLDTAMLLIQFAERDQVELIAPCRGVPPCFALPGVAEPRPIVSETEAPLVGLY